MTIGRYVDFEWICETPRLVPVSPRRVVGLLVVGLFSRRGSLPQSLHPVSGQLNLIRGGSVQR
jgi:hypothetical protein